MENEHAKEFAQMIKDSEPAFIEFKGFMSVGFARERLGYDRMPTHEEMLEFISKIEKELGGTGYVLQDEHKPSRAYVLCKRKEDLLIKEEDY